MAIVFLFFKTASALMHDAVKVFSSALRDFSLNADIELVQCDCANTTKWSQGELILKLLDKVIRLIYLIITDLIQNQWLQSTNKSPF